jgi:hypothetical protein
VPISNDSEAHAAPCTKDIGSFPGIKRPEWGAGHTPFSSVNVLKGLTLYLRLPCVSEQEFHRVTLPLFSQYIKADNVCMYARLFVCLFVVIYICIICLSSVVRGQYNVYRCFEQHVISEDPHNITTLVNRFQHQDFQEVM